MRVRWISRHGDCPYGEFLKAEGLGARRGRGIGRVRLRLLRLLRLLLLLGRRGWCASHRGNARRRGGRCPPVPLSTLRNTVSEKSDEAEIANVNLFSFFLFRKACHSQLSLLRFYRSVLSFFKNHNAAFEILSMFDEIFLCTLNIEY